MPAEWRDLGVRAAQAYSPRPLTDGERWTAEALGELRADGYRAAAWARFVGSSLRRSREVRRARPGLVRQARRWGAIGAGGWIVACRASRGCPDLRLRPVGGLAWWFAVWRMLDWHLGMAEGGDGRPRARLSPADAVTLLRFWLVPLTLGARRSRTGLPAVIAVGGLTDALDGALARRHGRTRLGRDLDTMADLCFLTAAGGAAQAEARLPRVGGWALVARHVVGVTLAAVAVFGRARRPAIRARPIGGALRFCGLALCATGRSRPGAVLLVAGCVTPPRSTARQLSRV